MSSVTPDLRSNVTSIQEEPTSDSKASELQELTITSDTLSLIFRRELLTLMDGLMVSYFSFGWDDTAALIKTNNCDEDGVCEDVNEDEETRGKMLWRKLKRLYFRRRTYDLLKAQREFKAMGTLLKIAREADIPQERREALNKKRELLRGNRNPVIVFLGGGMGSGKSSLVNEVN